MPLGKGYGRIDKTASHTVFQSRNFIYFLPGDILGAWLTLKSIVLLDSVFCTCSKRSNLLLLFGSKEYVLHEPVTLTNAPLLTWLWRKLVRSSTVKFGPETVSLYDLVSYISVVHDAIRCVHFFRVRNITEVMFSLACYCTKIVTISCTDVAMSAAFHALLLHNPNIKEIHAHNVSCPEEFPLIDLPLHVHDLQILSLTSIACLLSFAWPLLTDRSSLQRLECVLEVAFYLRSLRTLSFQHCSGLTDSSLSHIAKHCGSRLEIRYVNIQRPTDSTSEQIVKKFSEKCTALCSIDVHCETPLCTGACAYTLVTGCITLHTLVVNCIGVSFCQLSAVVRPSLKILLESVVCDVLTLSIYNVVR